MFRPTSGKLLLVLQNCGRTLFTNNIAAQPFGAILCEKFLCYKTAGRHYLQIILPRNPSAQSYVKSF